MSVLRKPSLRQLAVAVARWPVRRRRRGRSGQEGNRLWRHRRSLQRPDQAGHQAHPGKAGLHGARGRVQRLCAAQLRAGQGALDANAFQHVVYLKNFAAKNKLELSELVKVPTAPIAIYSRKYKSVDAAPEGVSVAVPNDPRTPTIPSSTAISRWRPGSSDRGAGAGKTTPTYQNLVAVRTADLSRPMCRTSRPTARASSWP